MRQSLKAHWQLLAVCISVVTGLMIYESALCAQQIQREIVLFKGAEKWSLAREVPERSFESGFQPQWRQRRRATKHRSHAPAVAADHESSKSRKLGPRYLARRRQGAAQDLFIAAGALCQRRVASRSCKSNILCRAIQMNGVHLCLTFCSSGSGRQRVYFQVKCRERKKQACWCVKHAGGTTVIIEVAEE